MYVEQIMTRNVAKCSEDTRVTHLSGMMHEHCIHHLPVVRDEDQFVGLVSFRDLQRLSPSPATTLSVGEANYLLGKLTASKVMHTEVVTCSPDTLVEDAAYLMRREGVGCLPVTRDGRLVGIVTVEDMLDFFLEITGCTSERTTRIAVRLQDRIGELAKLLSSINSAGGYIVTVVSPQHPDRSGMRLAIVRYRADEPQAVDRRLRELGYEPITENLPRSPG
ncbi:MAG: CBS domain-containing protein [Gammaproteobacteria bacterium]|nr:CBS domain-containing protein [Gammaproteobacteria bacterium]